MISYYGYCTEREKKTKIKKEGETVKYVGISFV